MSEAPMFSDQPVATPLAVVLRPYQQAAVDAVYTWFESHDTNPLLVLPTGSGKSICAAAFIHSVVTQFPSERILILTHVRELIAQNHAALLRAWPGAVAGICSAGIGRKEFDARILFAGIQTVHKKAERIGWTDLVVIDEAHLCGTDDMGMYRRFLGDLSSMNPKMKVIGLTATPYRTDSGRLDKGPGKLFGGIAYECDLVQLIEDGYLSRVISRGTKATIDTSEVHKRGGEFIAGELEMAAMLGDLVPQAAQEILSRAEGRKSLLLFCCGIAHAQAMAERMNALGVPCECVFGNTPKEERDEILDRFKRGELRAISNFGVLTTGFDAPNVDLIALLRPTCSPGLYVQMVGRGLRIAPGKADCLVLDFGQNVLRHGPLDHVQPTEKDGSEAPGEAPMKECPECMLLVAISARECPECGYAFPPPLATKHDPTPDERLEILRGKAAIVRWDVQRVDYREHHKKDKPTSLRVDYHCGFHQTVSEWVCFEHEGYARKKAEQWWKANGGALPVPETVDMARVRIDMGALRRVVSVTVDQREEYPKLLGVRHAEAGVVAMAQIEDDDLPF